MMLIIPFLPGSTQAAMGSPFSVLVKGVVFIVLVIISAKWIIPKLLFYIAKTGDRELFLLSIVALCFAVAWVTSMAGLSLALGAFLAGLIISESPYSHQAFGYVLPLRDAFTSFFFISIGMLLDLDFLMLNPAFIILLALGVMALKALIGGFATSVLGLPLRISVLIGLALSQIGEFSFILSQVGWNSGIINEEALYTALTSGKVAGAALDVFAEEPPVDWKLLKLDNVIGSPHIGAATKEAQGRVGAEVAQKLIDFALAHVKE